MGELETFGRIVDHCYAAATGQAEWADALGALRAATGAAGVNMQSAGFDGRFYTAVGLPDEGVAQYLEHYIHIDPRIQPAFLAGAGRVYSDLDSLTEAEKSRSAYFEDFLRPTGLRHLVGVNPILSRKAGDNLAIGLQQRITDNEVRPEVSRLLAALSPHFARAWRMAQSLSIERAAGLDGLSAPVFAITADGRVHWANAAAWRFAEACRGLGVIQNRLRAATPAGRMALDRAIAGALRGAATPARLPAGGPLQKIEIAWCVRAPSALAPLAPLLLTIARPAGAVRAEMLAAALDLTPAEARVAARVAEAKPAAEIARALGLSLPTVRTHIRALLLKTGARNQMELLTLIEAALGPAELFSS